MVCHWGGDCSPEVPGGKEINTKGNERAKDSVFIEPKSCDLAVIFLASLDVSC